MIVFETHSEYVNRALRDKSRERVWSVLNLGKSHLVVFNPDFAVSLCRKVFRVADLDSESEIVFFDSRCKSCERALRKEMGS